LSPGKLRWVPLSQADTESSAIMTKHHRTALAASFGRVLDHGLAHGYTTNPAVLLDLALRLGFSRKAPVAHGVREARLCDVQEACDALSRMPPSDLERVTAQYGRARVSDALIAAPGPNFTRRSRRTSALLRRR